MTEVQQNSVRATIVGSLPKPSWLCGPAEMFASWQLQGESLAEGQEDAVRGGQPRLSRAGRSPNPSFPQQPVARR